MNRSLLTLQWPAPKNVLAYSTTRLGGMSKFPYASFNLGNHVGDRLNHVLENRQIFQYIAQLPRPPSWLEQVHGTEVLKLSELATENYRADAAYTTLSNLPCAVMTADCLPVLLCTLAGNEVAAVHAGWRGLCNGIIENTLRCFMSPREQILAWLGPAIGPTKFEVGSEVYDSFVAVDSQAKQAFIPQGSRYLADIYALARMRLNASGVTKIYGGTYCTYTQQELFFSYRREQGSTGRMASVIWLN